MAPALAKVLPVRTESDASQTSDRYRPISSSGKSKRRSKKGGASEDLKIDSKSTSSSASSSRLNFMRKKSSSMSPRKSSQRLAVDTAAVESEYESRKSKNIANTPPLTAASGDSSIDITPSSNKSKPLRGNSDLRSPGVKATPMNGVSNFRYDKSNAKTSPEPIPSFITQTDRHGNATTPRVAPNPSKSSFRKSSKRTQQVDAVDKRDDNANRETPQSSRKEEEHDSCDNFLESLRTMCCCMLMEDDKLIENNKESSKGSMLTVASSIEDKVRLLPKIHPDDAGKKCLVLDLDETLVHSSFRAVPGADFVIPVQIEDVVHFVYVSKRPGVDEFLVEMAKYYEIVIYTASLNKYADPLLDLLDPHQVIRTRLFRESCVYYEGNYVKDLSLIDRELSQSIIVDNSPASYMFHPENAIDCSSYIDDPNDRELDQIGSFLIGVKDFSDVRSVCDQWSNWPVDNELSKCNER